VRAVQAGQQALVQVPAALNGAVVALIARDTRQAVLAPNQRLSHFPASPLLSLSWFHGMDIATTGLEPCARWQRAGSPVVVAGSQSRPTASWAPTTGQGRMLCFTAEAARMVFGFDPALVHDRFVPAHQVLGAQWHGLLDELLATPCPHAAMAALCRHLAPRWQAAHGHAGEGPSLRQVGRHWVERLAWQAHEWGRSRSTRQIERRIKSFTGRSMRQWQALVRTEGAFFAARDRHEAGMPYDWAELALQEGFADQSHFVRTSQRITGFSPTEFADRFEHDESFWLYRLWV
jgi:AraC-like DNA-binding protein